MATGVVGGTAQNSAIGYPFVLGIRERAEPYRLGRADQCLLWVTRRAQFERKHEVA
jgi:hypothetical protein